MVTLSDGTVVDCVLLGDGHVHVVDYETERDDRARWFFLCGTHALWDRWPRDQAPTCLWCVAGRRR